MPHLADQEAWLFEERYQNYLIMLDKYAKSLNISLEAASRRVALQIKPRKGKLLVPTR